LAISIYGNFGGQIPGRETRLEAPSGQQTQEALDQDPEAGKPGQQTLLPPPPPRHISNMPHALIPPKSAASGLPRVHLVHPKHGHSPPLPSADSSSPGGVEAAGSAPRCPDLPGDE